MFKEILEDEGEHYDPFTTMLEEVPDLPFFIGLPAWYIAGKIYFERRVIIYVLYYNIRNDWNKR
jgi:hypothetical protein